MSENTDYLGVEGRSRLYGDVLLLMLKGAGYACAFCLIVWFVMAVIIGIGRALPAESRDTPDPINRSSIELVQKTYFV
ncbi:Intrinsic membrane protein PufX [Cognatiyoonia koreensis]|uniref:Intrinsic membrane protein PufX n=1 Tax=Cognatiyoonia koreensis TaxID=364200 RepID=A0A1I0RKM1_9RHOB|nr:RC-LH1 core complex protein PufX [Cognatiyoonia koreensis]SEW41527.1 Intrinsic membrane protein PufX [Cognatiyoonia koreensis]